MYLVASKQLYCASRCGTLRKVAVSRISCWNSSVRFLSQESKILENSRKKSTSAGFKSSQQNNSGNTKNNESLDNEYVSEFKGRDQIDQRVKGSLGEIKGVKLVDPSTLRFNQTTTNSGETSFSSGLFNEPKEISNTKTLSFENDKINPSTSNLKNNSFVTSHKEREENSNFFANVSPATENFFERLSQWKENASPEKKLKDKSKPKAVETKSSVEILYPDNYPLKEMKASVEMPEAPVLQHDLDKVLFSPGVHTLKDPRTNVYNFPHHLEDIISIREFDFKNIPEFVPSAKDNTLARIASEYGLKYSSSTSSMTSVLTHLHFLISKNRSPNASKLSRHFDNLNTEFSYSTKKPVSLFLRWNNETQTYSLDTDRSQDEELILSLLGQVLEAKLTTSQEEFQNFTKPLNMESEALGSEERPKSTYHYSMCGDFALRSQIDCKDPRLPGTGVFDLKTRAVCAVRHDIGYAQIHEGSFYQIKSLQGLFESYEREQYDLIRSALFKYSLQARIGRMDGIFVAYHNIRKMFGFEYLPLADIDFIYHSIGLKLTDTEGLYENATSIAEREFQLSIAALSKILDAVTTKYPKKSVNLLIKSPSSKMEAAKSGSQMVVLANPIPDEYVELIQSQSPIEDTPSMLGKKAKKMLKNPEFQKKHERKYLDRHTLTQAFDEKFSGNLTGCSGWMVDVLNLIDEAKLAENVSPDPTPSENWRIELSIKPIKFFELQTQLQNILYNKWGDETKSTRLVSPTETSRKTPDEIEKQAKEYLKLLAEPTEFQRKLRMYDEKGKENEKSHNLKFGNKKPIIWSSISD